MRVLRERVPRVVFLDTAKAYDRSGHGCSAPGCGGEQTGRGGLGDGRKGTEYIYAEGDVRIPGFWHTSHCDGRGRRLLFLFCCCFCLFVIYSSRMRNYTMPFT